MEHPAAHLITGAIIKIPQWAIVLGSGLGLLADSLTEKKEWYFSELPGMVPATAPGHQGKVSAGFLGQQYVLIFAGRNHAYEGHTWETITSSMHLVHALGIQHVLLTSAVGAVHGGYALGDLVLIKDHLHLMPQRPRESIGPALQEIYDKEWFYSFAATAKLAGIGVKTGVLAVMTGPAYETRAEYRMLRVLGADLVGMSLVPEALAARLYGMRVLALSVVSDVYEDEIARAPVTAGEVLAEVERASHKVLQSVVGFINK